MRAWNRGGGRTDTFILAALLGSDGASLRVRHLTFVLLATMVMASIALWAGPSPRVLGQVSVTITMADITFEPDSFSVAPGASVTLTLINAGSLRHTFTLFNQAGANVPVNDDAALQAYYNDATNPKLVDMSFLGGAQQSTSFTAPTTEGTYTFVCMESGHSSPNGMHGTMIVTSMPTEGPAPIDPLLIGVVVAVVVIVIAVSAVFILRRRS